MHAGASFADMQNVAAFTCVEALGAEVLIPQTCQDEMNNVPLKVRFKKAMNNIAESHGDIARMLIANAKTHIVACRAA